MPLPFIFLTLFYFIFSGVNALYGVNEIEIIKEFIRSLAIVVFSVEVLHRTSKKEIFNILLIGAGSIIINALVFPLANANFYPTYGRYSGFYLNPNLAGSICLIGYSLSYLVPKLGFRVLGQFILTLAGILTFSRTFILIWLLINLVAIYRSRKNIITPIIGAGTFVIFFAISSMLSLNKERFSAFSSIFSNEQAVQTKTLGEDSRTETWALYTEYVLDKPLFGNGYYFFQLHRPGLPGVHNSYLMVIGEAGILPFLIMIGIYLFILYRSLLVFKTNPEYLYLSLTISIYLMTGHGYFDNYCNIFISMYVYINVKEKLLNEQQSIFTS
ncbi:O-antigen ligase family protein [Zobellia uliginosa]|nr:O-antigen ligase family protein [Zobellia uliginosa]